MFGSRQVQKSVSSCTLLGNSAPQVSMSANDTLQKLQTSDNQQGSEFSQNKSNAVNALQTLSFEIGNRQIVAVSRRWYDRVGYSQKRWATTITFDDNTTMDILSTREVSASIECTLKTAPYSNAQRAQDIEQCFADWGITV